ncbi:CHAT domain-containing protein [Irpex rosettiformis]|uniref:CHAT domain-containing protein n=1 Tax=Irpex rosettiformis TaxID=378272 RepID=A0ACB8TVG0_9APHY|nr:CHAT domain-containing protein [Irpex rosettiformis]
MLTSEPRFSARVESSSLKTSSKLNFLNDLPLDISMRMLADHAYEQYKAGGDLKVLEFAIQSYHVAIDATKDDSPDKVATIHRLGIALYARSQCVGESQDLEESISLKQLANVLTPDNSPDKHLLLSSLATSILSRFEREGRVEDLEEAIGLWTSALELQVPDGHIDKPLLLNNLGDSLRIRFEYSGSISDLEKAIEVHGRAVDLTPDGHSDKAWLLKNLGNAFERRFGLLGNLDDLEMAVVLNGRCVDLTPDGHPNKPNYLDNAGGSLQARFSRLGSLEDIEQAIMLQTQAVALTSDAHSRKPGLLNNLANSLQDLYERTRDMKDLENAIAHQTRAVDLSPDTHRDKSIHLNNLGIKLYILFKQSGNRGDLDKAITHQTRALELTSKGHFGKSTWLYNLGCLLGERFKQTDDIEDLNEAIRCSSRSVELLQENHTGRASMLRSLGTLSITRLQSSHGAQAEDATCAMEAFLEAMQHPNSHPLEKLQASGQYANLLTEFSNLFAVPPRLTLLGAYGHAMSLIPQCVWLGNNVRSRYTSDELSIVGEVANDAVTAAIVSGQYGLALEWMEAGRAVVWSQVLQLRTPLDDLRRLHPQLADDLHLVSQALQLAASPSSTASLPASTETQLFPDIQAKSSHGLALEYEKLITRIRELEGFEGFLRPKTLAQLAGASISGPVVVIIVHKSRCDALVLHRTGEIVHVPLPHLSLSCAMDLQKSLWDILRAKRLLNRCRDDLRDERDDRGGRVTAMDPPDLMRIILANLWNWVVKPIMDVVCTLVPPSSTLPHVTWCPTGPLVFLPLHAAGIYPSDDRINAPSQTIMDIAVSSYTPTLEALLKPRARVTPAGQDPRVLIVSQPDTPGGSPIPGTTTEAAIVMSLVGESKPLDDADGTVQAVLEGMTTHEWVHLACHGAQNHADPINSAFLLYDGRLTLAELMSHHLPNVNADLAVLSACQTATGDEKLPEEAVHLAAGMLNIGYKSVIGTMWSISDHVAPDVMKVFYTVMAEQVKAGGDLQPAYALHEATKALRNSNGRGGLNDFLRWVPFVHFGL